MIFNKQKTIVLTGNDVRDIVQHYGIHDVMDTLIARTLAAFSTFDPETTAIPARSGFSYDNPASGLVEWMPLHGRGDKVVIKVVGYHPNNPDKYNLPTILSTISAYDTATGHLLGLMDGVLLTALRTGAASAVASLLLADPGSRILGLIGCGAQAVTQLHALSRRFDFDKVLIYDNDDGALSSFPDRCTALDLDITIIPSPIPDIVAAADILCTATSVDVGKGPLFSDLPAKPSLHVNAVGADFPGKVELPLSLLTKSFVCPDFREQAVIEGECQQLAPGQIGPGLVEVAQNPGAYKHIQKQQSVFDSTGWALEDQVVMELFLEYAGALGLGKEMEIEAMPDDAKNPYYFMETSNMAVKKDV